MRRMKWAVVAGFASAMAVGGVGLAAEADTQQPAAVTATAESVDPLMGEYEGTCTVGDALAKAEAKVFPVKGGAYHIALTITPPAPAAAQSLVLTGTKQEKSIVPAEGQQPQWTGSIGDGKLSAEVKNNKLEMSKVIRKSPTEGAQPPAGAIVLLPMVDGKLSLAEWTGGKWKALPDGSMQAARGDTRTVKSFGDAQLHVEFMTPYEPNGSGQGRGNSGVYLQDRYEVQVLDSFGLKPTMGDCGAIYGIAVPPVNPSLPPLTWQTYDITFKAARFDAQGQVTSNPRITVVFNGVKIHDNVELTKVTGGAAGQTHVAKAPLRLQDHQHPVRFRNIWVVPLDEQSDAK